jgi:hypothetical protein
MLWTRPNWMRRGLVSRKILVVGDSHAHALKQALKSSTEAAFRSRFEILTLSRLKNGSMFGDASLEVCAERAAGLTEGDCLVSLIGGNQHHAFGLVQHPIKFDFFERDTSRSDIDSDAQTVPRSTLQGVFHSGLKNNDFRRLSVLREGARCSVMHLAAPPPKHDEEHILERHESNFSAQNIMTNGISAAPLRLKLWRLQMEVTQELCAEIDVDFVAFPSIARDSDGFLATEFYAKDATHVNRECGHLLLSLIHKRAAELDRV